MNKFENEPEYVQHFWENETPIVRTQTTRIYVLHDEFPELKGRNQLCLQECHSGNVMELV